MVTIVDYSLRTTALGKSFFSLFLQGGLELIKSSASDMHYATIMKCSIPSTFDEATCKSLIGKQLPGIILKKNCEPFEVLNKNTGEMVVMNYRYMYSPEEPSAEHAIFEGETESPLFR